MSKYNEPNIGKIIKPIKYSRDKFGIITVFRNI